MSIQNPIPFRPLQAGFMQSYLERTWSGGTIATVCLLDVIKDEFERVGVN